MERIDCLLFGYRRVAVAREDLSVATSLLLRGGIIAKIGTDGGFSVRERDLERLCELLRGKVEYQLSEPLGVPGRIKSFPHKLGASVGLVTALILTLFLSSLVWDVRVEGNDEIPDARIVYELSECGFSVGSLWLLSDRSEVEAMMLANNPELSWININRRGSVAYVIVAEKVAVQTSGEQSAAGYSNIVASCDCVIEEITVSSGVAMVKPGDTVRRGDLLICGVLPESAGGGFCAAEGSVIGRVGDRVTASVSREYEKTVAEHKKITDITLKIFDFSINIFKIYGNSAERCDIIKEIQTFSIGDRARLPVEIQTSLTVEREFATALYDDARLVRLCTKRLLGNTVSRTVGAQIIKIRTYGDYTDTGYEMYSDIVYLADVGESLPFEAEE